MTVDHDFCLLAPENEAVLLQGDFSDWCDIPMQRDGCGVWRCRVSLGDGSWWYRFRLKTRSPFWEPGHWVEIIDPWAREVDEVKRAARLELRGGQAVETPYRWRHPLPQIDPYARVAYEIYLGDFGGSRQRVGGFSDARRRLDHLVSLGANELLCMPVMAFPGRKSWGYNPAWPFAVERAYGSPSELKSLIDAAHGLGLRFIGDMLFNHVTQDCPLTWIDYRYWFRAEPKDPEWNWGPEWDYDHYDAANARWPAREFAEALMDFWVRGYRFDGVRHDAVKQLDHPEMLARLASIGKSAAQGPGFVNIAEHIPDKPELVTAGPMDATWHDSFCHLIRNAFRGSDADPDKLKDALDPRRRGYTDPTQVYNYLSTHDQGRFLACMLEAGFSPQQARMRYELAVQLLLTGWGLPMIRMGDEWGEVRWHWFESQHELTPLDWEGLTRPAGKRLFRLHQELIRLRQAHPALQRGDVEFIWQAGLAMAYQRRHGDDIVIIAINPTDEPHRAGMPVPSGTWHRFDTRERLEGESLSLSLKPWQAQIWSNA